MTAVMRALVQVIWTAQQRLTPTSPLLQLWWLLEATLPQSLPLLLRVIPPRVRRVLERVLM